METTKTATLKFKAGRDNAMVGNLSAMIEDVHGHYIVLADARYGLKPDVQYQVDLKPMKSKKGFVVLKAVEVCDKLEIRKEGECVNVYVCKFGESKFELEARYSYDRAGEVYYGEVAERIKNANRGYVFRSIILSDDKLNAFVDEFVRQCKALRAGGVDKEISDELLAKVEGDVVNVYIKFSYEDAFTKSPLASYNAEDGSYEDVMDVLEDYFKNWKLIMPEEAFDAFLDDFSFICKSRDKERLKEVKGAFKGKKFTKKVKLVGGESEENYED